MKLETATLSLAGNEHPGDPEGNWDALLCAPSPESPEPPLGLDLIAAVADGVTSTPQGGRASRAAVGAIQRWVQKAFTDVPDDRLRGYGDRDFDDLLANAIRRTHDTVAQQVPEGHTTLALVCVRGERLLCANLGDTRIYRWRDGELRQLSEDHHSGQGLTRWVGGSHVEASPALRVAEEVHPGDVLLLCSDGFYELYPEEELRGLAEWMSRNPLPRIWPRIQEDVDGRMREHSAHHVDDASLVVVCARGAAESVGVREYGSVGDETGERGRATGDRPTPRRSPVPGLPSGLPHPHAPTLPHSEDGDEKVTTLTDTRMQEAVEELTAAVRLLRTQLANEAQASRERRHSGGPVVSKWLFSYGVPAALLLGLALGLAGATLGRGRQAPAEPIRPKEFALKVAPPADLGTVVSESIEGDTYRLTYVTRDKRERRTLAYWIRSDAEEVQPYGKVIVPIIPPSETSRE